MDRSNFRLRAISAAFIGIAIIGSTLLGFVPAAVLIGLITILSVWELMRLNHSTPIPEAVLTSLAAVAPWAYGIYYWYEHGDLSLEEIFLANGMFSPITVLFAALIIMRRINDPAILLLKFAFAMIFFGFGASAALAMISIDPRILLGVFILLWASDVTAYLVGSTIGKTKLAAHISPGKTVEGVIGDEVWVC